MHNHNENKKILRQQKFLQTFKKKEKFCQRSDPTSEKLFLVLFWKEQTEGFQNYTIFDRRIIVLARKTSTFSL